MMALQETEMHIVDVVERTSSALSLLGAAFIISTFLTNKGFHKPINRLVFYACWGNLMTNIATLISLSGPRTGVNGPLCQFQGFLIQMFMPADALWTLAMACNVYLAFFRKYSARNLRSLEWLYGLCCYGIPLVPALIYCFIDTPTRGKIYGSAVMWCWISIKWDILRVAVFYAPVWVVILIIFGIYIKTGIHIFEQTQPLRELQQELRRPNTGGEKRVSLTQNPFLVQGITKTTDVLISYEDSSCSSPSSSTPGTILSSDEIKHLGPGATYSVKIEGPRPTAPSTLCPSSVGCCFGGSLKRRRMSDVANKAAYSYCKCAVLFFIALLVTWVPSSINRVYSLILPDEVSFGLTLASSLVLPLQGFWNAIIYIATSLPACQALIRTMMGKVNDVSAIKETASNESSTRRSDSSWS